MAHVTDTSGADDQMKTLFNQGLQQYQDGHYSESLETFKQLETLRPHASEVALNIGNSYFQLGLLDQARQYLEKSLGLDPMEAMAYLNLGNVYFKQEQFEKAVFYWEQCRTLVKDNPTVWLNMGVAYDRLSMPDKALRSYSVYLGLEPKSMEAARLRARFESAKRVFENNIKVAEQYLANSDSQKARDIYQKELAQYPGTVKIYKTYASLLYHLGDLQESLNYYLKAHELRMLEEIGADPGILINLGVIFEKLNRPVDALWAYTLASEIESPETQKVQARHTAVLNGVRQQSTALLEGYIQEIRGSLRQPGKAELGRRQAHRLALLAGYFPALKNDIEDVYDDAEVLFDPTLRAAKTYLSRGNDAKQQGKLDQALGFYQKFLSLRPSGEKANYVKQQIQEITQMMGAVVSSLLAAE